jgi:hypothetical protein
MTTSSASRRLAILVVAGASLLTACSSGSDSAATTPVAPETTLAPESPETAAGICDYNPDPDALPCTENILEFEDSQAGALERMRNGSTWPEDLRYFMYDEEYWNANYASTIGAATLVPGSQMPFYGLYLEALEEIPTAFAWQQEWKLADGAFVVEHAILLTSADDATKAADAWKTAALRSGLLEAADVEGPEGSFTTTFTDSEGIYPERACAAQSIVAVGPMLLSVLHLSGGDCRAIPAYLTAYLLGPLAERASRTFIG